MCSPYHVLIELSKVVVTSCCNWTEVLSGLYISSGLLNAHQGKEKPYKSV